MIEAQLESEKKRREELESGALSKAQSQVQALWQEQDIAAQADRSKELNLARSAVSS